MAKTKRKPRRKPKSKPLGTIWEIPDACGTDPPILLEFCPRSRRASHRRLARRPQWIIFRMRTGCQWNNSPASSAQETGP